MRDTQRRDRSIAFAKLLHVLHVGLFCVSKNVSEGDWLVRWEVGWTEGKEEDGFSSSEVLQVASVMEPRFQGKSLAKLASPSLHFVISNCPSHERIERNSCSHAPPSTHVLLHFLLSFISLCSFSLVFLSGLFSLAVASEGESPFIKTLWTPCVSTFFHIKRSTCKCVRVILSWTKLPLSRLKHAFLLKRVCVDIASKKKKVARLFSPR